MIILGCTGISLSFGMEKLLDNMTFNVKQGEKVGIVGVNGAGKSTLIKIITGNMQPDSGDVFIAKGFNIGYLEQNSGLNSANSIWDEVMTAYSRLVDMEKQIKSLEGRISSEKDENSLSSCMKEYAALTEKFSQSGGYEYNSRVKGILKGLGFEEEQFGLKVGNLSGGQKTRMALAKLLAEEPDVLMLDEPTNHLDINALEWLEEFLTSYRKTILLISHDRYFLDKVTNMTLELENCECRMYKGSYSEYVKQKASDREIQQKHYELQQKEIARMEAYIEQQRRWNREKNIIAAESRQKAIDRMEKLEKPKNQPESIKIKFRSSIISGNDVLFVEELSKQYPGKPLFRNISFKLRKQEKVFLLGPNGCGKSTLLKILVGKLDKTSGSFEYGHKIKIGYYDQELEGLDESNTIIDEVWNSNEKLTHTEIRDALALFRFSGEDVFKPVSILSGGEKSRVALVKLVLSGSNFLVLDEPTNHLDISSREVLEQALSNFDGTILAVSHDRYFINKLATRIMELGSTSVLDCPGNYSFYLERRNKLKQDLQDVAGNTRVSQSKLERMSVKEEKSKLKRLERQLIETEKEIGDIETRLEDIEVEMTSEDVFSDHVRLSELNEEQDSLKLRLEELYELWEELASENASMDSTV